MAFGRFERTGTSRPFSDINVTPLVDVMLVLVVIFILTAPLLSSSIRLDLPQAAGTSPGVPPQAIRLVLDRQGLAYLDDEPLADEPLAQRLAQRAQLQPEAEVQLRADAAVPYGRVVQVMGAAHAAGLKRIGFVAEPAASPGRSSR
ncbi:MAG: biopolymer transporter ExbD [Comamonadaceae bacterium]|nr:MAG: biopolymer transporter ExbD [Comamonadaceae bacterium]